MKKETLTQVFAWKFGEICKNTFFIEHLRWLLPDLFDSFFHCVLFYVLFEFFLFLFHMISKTKSLISWNVVDTANLCITGLRNVVFLYPSETLFLRSGIKDEIEMKEEWLMLLVFLIPIAFENICFRSRSKLRAKKHLA